MKDVLLFIRELTPDSMTWTELFVSKVMYLSHTIFTSDMLTSMVILELLYTSMTIMLFCWSNWKSVAAREEEFDKDVLRVAALLCHVAFRQIPLETFVNPLFLNPVHVCARARVIDTAFQYWTSHLWGTNCSISCRRKAVAFLMASKQDWLDWLHSSTLHPVEYLIVGAMLMVENETVKRLKRSVK